MLPNMVQCWALKNQMPLIPNMMAWTEWAKAHGPRQLGSPPLLNGKGMPKEGRKEILLMRATTEVDWHVNVWSEQISGPQIYQGKQ